MTTILLAAGLSTRMGRNKLLLPFKGKTIIENTLSSLIPFSDRIIVVTGFEKERIEKILKGYNCFFIYNKEYEKGQRGSSICGVREVKDDDFLIVPADLPLLSSVDIDKAIRELKNSKIVRLSHSGIPGHPVFYKKENQRNLLSFSGSMKDYLFAVGFKEIESSIGSVFDTDTKEKYEALLTCNTDLSILENYIH